MSITSNNLKRLGFIRISNSAYLTKKNLKLIRTFTHMEETVYISRTKLLELKKSVDEYKNELRKIKSDITEKPNFQSFV